MQASVMNPFVVISSAASSPPCLSFRGRAHMGLRQLNLRIAVVALLVVSGAGAARAESVALSLRIAALVAGVTCAEGGGGARAAWLAVFAGGVGVGADVTCGAGRYYQLLSLPDVYRCETCFEVRFQSRAR